MPSKLSAIVGAMVTALSAAQPVSAQIYRARLRPLAAHHTDAVVVRVRSSTPSAVVLPGAALDWQSQIDVEIYARTTTTIAPDLALDTLWLNTYARLMTNSLLGGLLQCELLCTHLGYDFAIDSEHTARLVSTWQAKHRTTHGVVV